MNSPPIQLRGLVNSKRTDDPFPGNPGHFCQVLSSYDVVYSKPYITQNSIYFGSKMTSFSCTQVKLTVHPEVSTTATSNNDRTKID